MKLLNILEFPKMLMLMNECCEIIALWRVFETHIQALKTSYQFREQSLIRYQFFRR
jgi:division protein CdvB (Snf7/Vps24/ESCRT-III family)